MTNTTKALGVSGRFWTDSFLVAQPKGLLGCTTKKAFLAAPPRRLSWLRSQEDLLGGATKKTFLVAQPQVGSEFPLGRFSSTRQNRSRHMVSLGLPWFSFGFLWFSLVFHGFYMDFRPHPHPTPPKNFNFPLVVAPSRSSSRS